MVVEKTDADLVQEVLSGDPDAFNPLVARYQQSVFALAGSIVRDLDAAEDITQEVFIAAYTRKASRTFQRPSPSRWSRRNSSWSG